MEGFRYRLVTTGAPEDLTARVNELMARDEILIERKVKQKKPKKGRGWKKRGKAIAEIDIRPCWRRWRWCARTAPTPR